MRKSFVLHIDSLCVLDDLSDEQRGQLFYAIYQYQLGNEVEASPIVKIAFSQFKNQFNRDDEKYVTLCEKNRQIALNRHSKHGVTKSTKRNEALPSVTKSTDNKNKSDSKSKSDSDSNIINTCASLTVDIVQEDEFDLFWKAYPKKVGKDKARIAWKKKKHKPHIEFILEAVQRYKFSKTVRDGFVCHPTTWINEGRWSDEVELSDYDKSKAIQQYTGMSPSEIMAIQLAEADAEWERNNA